MQFCYKETCSAAALLSFFPSFVTADSVVTDKFNGHLLWLVYSSYHSKGR